MADEFDLRFEETVFGESGAGYKCIQQLGEGGNAVTYLVLATSGLAKGSLFAMKVFRNLSMPERQESFFREIRFLRAGQHHPSIMAVHDEGDVRGTNPFVIAEYLPLTLRQFIRGQAATTVDKLSCAVQLLGAFSYLEQLQPPVVHRDVKPENIFIKGRSCILGDFGLMRTQVQFIEDDPNLGKLSPGAGMPRYYRSPEQVTYLLGGLAPTTKSDLFQLGLVLAELFTGKNPSKPTRSVRSKVALERLSPIPGDLQAGTANLIENLLELDPANRWPASTHLDAWESLFFERALSKRNLDGFVL